MIITLDTITLPSDMRWINQYSATNAKTNRQRAISGKQYIHRYVLAGGKDINLSGGNNYGWIDKVTLDALQALYNSANSMVLTIDGTAYNVLFKDDGLQADPLQWFDTFEDTDLFIPRLQFYTLGSGEFDVP